MTVSVSFIVGKLYETGAVCVERVRAMETVAVAGTTTGTARAGELIIVGNAESSMIRVAYGTTPDADATAETGATSAGFPVGAGDISAPFIANAGDKVNVELND